jgi:5-methylcytosine-specific restriction endonuclease McrA
MAPSIPPGLPRAERVARVLERDGSKCVWCGRPLAVGDRELSIDHVVPRLKGGPAWAENEVPACASCNRRRGHAAPTAYLEACRARGLEPDAHAIAAALAALQAAVAARGGQRRARPYLERELRRLAALRP